MACLGCGSTAGKGGLRLGVLGLRVGAARPGGIAACGHADTAMLVVSPPSLKALGRTVPLVSQACINTKSAMQTMNIRNELDYMDY